MFKPSKKDFYSERYTDDPIIEAPEMYTRMILGNVRGSIKEAFGIIGLKNLLGLDPEFFLYIEAKLDELYDRGFRDGRHSELVRYGKESDRRMNNFLKILVNPPKDSSWNPELSETKHKLAMISTLAGADPDDIRLVIEKKDLGSETEIIIDTSDEEE